MDPKLKKKIQLDDQPTIRAASPRDMMLGQPPTEDQLTKMAERRAAQELLTPSNLGKMMAEKTNVSEILDRTNSAMRKGLAEGSLAAGFQQLGKPNVTAPSGDEVAKRWGIPDKSVKVQMPLHDPLTERYTPGQTEEMPVDFNPRKVAGTAMELVSPEDVVPVGMVLGGIKAAGKVLKSAKKVDKALDVSKATKGLSKAKVPAKLRKEIESIEGSLRAGELEELARGGEAIVYDAGDWVVKVPHDATHREFKRRFYIDAILAKKGFAPETYAVGFKAKDPTGRAVVQKKIKNAWDEFHEMGKEAFYKKYGTLESFNGKISEKVGFDIGDFKLENLGVEDGKLKVIDTGYAEFGSERVRNPDWLQYKKKNRDIDLEELDNLDSTIKAQQEALPRWKKQIKEIEKDDMYAPRDKEQARHKLIQLEIDLERNLNIKKTAKEERAKIVKDYEDAAKEHEKSMITPALTTPEERANIRKRRLSMLNGMMRGKA